MPTGIKGILEDGKRNGRVTRVDNSHLTYSTHLLAADPNLCPCNRHGPSLAILCESNCLQEFTAFFETNEKKNVKALEIVTDASQPWVTIKEVKPVGK